MTETAKPQTGNDNQEERARILRLISERWNGNLTAYLEAVARVRNNPAPSSVNADNEVSLESLLRVSRR